MMTNEQAKRHRLLRRAYEIGKSKHFAEYNQKKADGKYLNPALMKLVEACQAFDARKDREPYDQYLADLEGLLRALYNYGCHSWCVSGQWRWYVAGLLGEYGEL